MFSYQSTSIREIYLLVVFADRSGMILLCEPSTIYRNFWECIIVPRVHTNSSSPCCKRLQLDEKLILCKVSCNFSAIKARRSTMRYPLGSGYLQHKVLQGFPLLYKLITPCSSWCQFWHQNSVGVLLRDLQQLCYYHNLSAGGWF